MIQKIKSWFSRDNRHTGSRNGPSKIKCKIDTRPPQSERIADLLNEINIMLPEEPQEDNSYMNIMGANK